ALPAGFLQLSGDGVMSGVPPQVGSTTISVAVTDSAMRKVTALLPVVTTAGQITIDGPGSAASAQQPLLKLSMDSATFIDLGGTVNLSFISSVGGADDMVRFANGSRTTDFTIPAGSTTTSIPILTGTVTGRITLTMTSDSFTSPPKMITIDPAPPVITAVL